MDLAAKIRTIPDFPIKGIQFKDITPLLLDPEAFAEVIDVFVGRYEGRGITKIIGVESRGFIFGAALAHRLRIGFVPIRKKGKLPADTLEESYDLEYGKATVEIHRDALTPNDHVVLLDDLMATGGTLAASCLLIERLGAKIEEVITVIELTFLNGRQKLEGRPYHTLLQF